MKEQIQTQLVKEFGMITAKQARRIKMGRQTTREVILHIISFIKHAAQHGNNAVVCRTLDTEAYDDIMPLLTEMGFNVEYAMKSKANVFNPLFVHFYTISW